MTNNALSIVGRASFEVAPSFDTLPGGANGLPKESRSGQKQIPNVGIFFEENLLNHLYGPSGTETISALVRLAEEIGHVRHASAHISFSPRRPLNKSTRQLAEDLEELGFTIDLKPRGLVGNKEKSRVDPDISFLIGHVVARKDIDIVVLGSADSDYVNIVRLLKTMGVKTLVICPAKRTASAELLHAATTYVGLDELKEVRGYAA